MPDGSIQTDFTYRPALRSATAPLIMVAGPPGTGKTYSALRLARGLAGPDGLIYLADTDNGRANFYADEFTFRHLNLHEPFRPMIFERAAVEAQSKGAAVLIIDNFMHEHVGPGGLLDWHDELNIKMARGDDAKLESTKMLAWVAPKQAHKKMRERLYQLNMPVILCCGAEHKIAMVKQTEGRDKGKTIPVDQGLVAICGTDIPWAMTVSLMLPDPKNPGVPVPIKALLPALKPIVALDKPIDEEMGSRIAAWASGKAARSTPAAPVAPAKVKPVAPAEAVGQSDVPPSPPPDESQERDTADSTAESAGESSLGEQTGKRQPDRPLIGARAIAQRFKRCRSRRDHLKLVDDAQVRMDIDWLRANRPELYEEIVQPALMDSWQRTEPQDLKAARQEGLPV